MGDENTLRLTSLEIENILRIKAASLTFGDGALIIEGGNEEGKTSVIESLVMLLAGMNATPDEPIHGDEKKGKIVGTFGDLTVTKQFTRGKRAALHIKSGKQKFSSPQGLLDSFFNIVALRPLKWLAYDSAKKLVVLSDLMGLDTAKLDREEEGTYDARKDANREAKRLQAAYESLPEHPDAPAEEVKVAELLAELGKLRKHNNEHAALVLHESRTHDKLSEAKELKAGLEERVRNLDAEIEALTEQHGEAAVSLVQFQPRDETTLLDQIGEADEANAAVRANAAKAEAGTLFRAATTKAFDLDNALKDIQKRKTAAREEAASRLPIPGLTVTEGGIFYKGKPLAQAGSSAQLRLSVAVAMALNKDKRIKLLLLDDAEKLDPRSTEVVLQMAQEKGFQVLLARVGDGKDATVLIEDGTVKDA